MKKITNRELQKLLNLHLAVTVENAMDKGELNLFNIYSWTMKYNMNMEDARLLREVTALVEHFSYH